MQFMKWRMWMQRKDGSENGFFFKPCASKQEVESWIASHQKCCSAMFEMRAQELPEGYKE